MARQPTAREFSSAYNACTTAYRNRLKRAGLNPGDAFPDSQPVQQSFDRSFDQSFARTDDADSST